MLSRLGEDLEGGNHALYHSNLSSDAWDDWGNTRWSVDCV